MTKIFDTEEIWGNLCEVIYSEESLASQDVIIPIGDEDYRCYFEEVDGEDWTCNEYRASTSSIYRVSLYTLDNEFIEDLDLYLKQFAYKSLENEYDDNLDCYIEYDMPFVANIN